MARPTAVLLLLAIAVLFLLLVEGCDEGSGAPGDGGRLQVLATIAPAEALARAVAGDAADVDVLVEPGTDPHEFDPSPQDRRKLDDAGLVIQVGLGIDAFADGAETVLTLSEGVPLRHSEENGEPDPHIWHDPENCILMVEALADRYSALDPANAAIYEANAAAARERLQAADAQIRALIDEIPPSQRKMVTNHDAFGYFIDRYGLEFVGAVIPSLSTSAEPSAEHVSELIELIEREGVRAIFSESSVDPDVARRIAADTGVEIVDDLYSDTLGAPGSGADTIEGMLLANARKIAAALG
jgi:ABC-type Zn uptake system ZnuABC Zn-binding protein ZnuA